mgnify:CR=1 FL=1
MKIAGVSSAFPKYHYSQEVLAAAAAEYWRERVEHPELIQRLFARCGVEARFLTLPMEEYPKLGSWGEANDHWIETAEELGYQSLCRALARAGLSTNDLGALLFTSVTGICSPSIDARLINRMDLPKNIRRVPMFGLGCVAGAAGIARAADYVRAYPDQVAAIVAVELCSLTIQRDDLSMANLISTGLFGDGGATVLVAGANRADSVSGPVILDTRSVFYPNTEYVMGWDISEKGFQIVLSKEVPEMVRRHLADDVDAFLADNDLDRGDIGSYVIHTGGPAVLEATQESLKLPKGALDASWHCLSKTGNLSSASVLCVLEETMLRRRPAPGTLGLMAAMGPGFCSELLLLRW